MPFASGSGVRVAMTRQSAHMAALSNPVFAVLRTTNGGLRTTKSTGTSNERQPDRNVRDEFELGQDVAGSYDFELTYGTFDSVLENLLCSSWATNVLKNGIVPKFDTFEETYELGATDTFRRFSDCQVNTMSLAIGARAAVTGSFGIMGRAEAIAETAVTGATYTDPTETPVATASANVSALTLTGAGVTQPKVRNLTLDISNNMRIRPEVGSKYSNELGLGRFDVTGTLDCYFQTKAAYEACLAHGQGDLSFVVGVGANQKYKFEMGKIQLGDGNVTAGGNDDDIMTQIQFRALLSADDCTLKITRAVA